MGYGTHAIELLESVNLCVESGLRTVAQFKQTLQVNSIRSEESWKGYIQ